MAFTQDDAVDITNHPEEYANYGGAAIRIQVYWTAAVAIHPDLYQASLECLKATNELFKKYSLSLDWQPTVGPVDFPSRFSATVGNSTAAKLTTALRWLQDIAKSGYASKFDKRLVAASIGSTPQEQVNYQAQVGLLNITDVLLGNQTDAEYARFYDALPFRPTENRLIVIFTATSDRRSVSPVNSPWRLPFCLVNPGEAKLTLAHEIGHAARLEHQEDNIKNLMYPDADPQWDQSHLWGWQTAAYYNSYWCKGPRPENWWERGRTIGGQKRQYLWGLGNDPPPEPPAFLGTP